MSLARSSHFPPSPLQSPSLSPHLFSSFLSLSLLSFLTLPSHLSLSPAPHLCSPTPHLPRRVAALAPPLSCRSEPSTGSVSVGSVSGESPPPQVAEISSSRDQRRRGIVLAQRCPGSVCPIRLCAEPRNLETVTSVLPKGCSFAMMCHFLECFW